MNVRAAFIYAYHTLLAKDHLGSSFLSRILRIDKVLELEQFRQFISKLYYTEKKLNS